MQIVPVIDLKGGIVVHARMGRRDQYRPIETPLARSSDPVDVVSGLLSVHPFKTLYVADLDAIERIGDNHAALEQLHNRFPNLTLWVDNGIADRAAAQNWLDRGLGHMVIGSERQTDNALLRQHADDPRIVLSLDFAAAFSGPAVLLEEDAFWPKRVIVMTLARVGSGSGPDLERIDAIRGRAPHKQFYAAGGVRDGGDLAALKQRGVAGALVASCLHNGRLSAAEIEALQG